MNQSKVDKIYQEIYPDHWKKKLSEPTVGYTLNEIRLRPTYADLAPHEVDLRTTLGPVKLNLPLISAAMDTVTGAAMAKAMSEIGGCGIVYRHKKAETQLAWLKTALEHKPCLVASPKCLQPDEPLENAQDILNEYGFSTIPVVTKDNVLVGILFTKDIAFKGRSNDKVEKWMKPLAELKVEKANATFERIKDRLLNEQECSALPIVDKQKKLKGIYFMKDFFQANPAMHLGRPLVGMAVGVQATDLDRVKAALEMGAGMIVIDSSHGNCPAVINQTEKIIKMAKGKAAVISGNVADIDGYYRLADLGVDGVKCGIGSGSICTTSRVTGAGVPMFTLIRELSYARARLLKSGKKAPAIIPDGGINGPGDMVIALAAGGDLCMAGKWLVSAKESLSFEERGLQEGMVYYRGMASLEAIEKRVSDRYGKQKRAAEGVSGGVEYRGPLKSWIGNDIELVQGGFAHGGAKNIKELHEYGNHPLAFVRFTSFGQDQINTRVHQF